jgi:hypothetical protein
MQHQQTLKKWGVARLFSPMNHQRATWITFTIALVINALYLFYYESVEVPCTTPESLPIYGDSFNETMLSAPNSTSYGAVCTLHSMHDNVQSIATTLNSISCISSSFTLVMYLLVRVPVIYMNYLADGRTETAAVLATSTDAWTIYYFTYVIMAIISVNYGTAASFLLLDIVAKVSVAREVLNAVYKPRKQFIMSLVFTAIILYIYAFVTVRNMRTGLILFRARHIHHLLNLFCFEHTCPSF